MTPITGIFRDRMSAEQAISQMENAGVRQNQISLVMTDDARGNYFSLKESSKVDEGAAAGAGVGGLMGALAGLAFAAGTIAIPGVNLVVTGALVSALAGLGAGATAGGLLGGLIGAGIPEHEAKIYEKEIKGGNVLVAVDCENSDQKVMVQDIFDNYNAKSKAA
jgi:hypothetical protein